MGCALKDWASYSGLKYISISTSPIKLSKVTLVKTSEKWKKTVNLLCVIRSTERLDLVIYLFNFHNKTVNVK